MVRTLILVSIRFYQKTLSPDHGFTKALFPHGYCKFSPSCSQYSYEAVARYGALKGSALALGRIIRCNPWTKGGRDEVPSRNV